MTELKPPMKMKLRIDVLKRRDEIPPDKKAVKDSLIKGRLFALPEFIRADTVLFYASFRSEVDTSSMINDSLRMGKKVVLPRVDKERHVLLLFEVSGLSDLKAGYMGIPEPSLKAEKAVSIEDVDVVVIPGAAFDTSGNRVGYGAGYYDILLSNRKNRGPVIALAYEEQIVGSVPAERHDVRVDMIITDERELRNT